MPTWPHHHGSKDDTQHSYWLLEGVAQSSLMELRLYEQVGLGWVYAITKYEPIIKRLENLACSFAEAQLLKSKRLLWSRKQLFSHLTK
ncbi:hypothetical protein CMV_022498 [Castanea mollissima]|uniref:Uncharacterized protein n=1 Tax=Castanea mollissima TaxID=60419 RepID=A0A8J4VBJ7_9ROSI|nr:hypothetical protein CMV_022498 [Castanea mollissima]